MAGKVKKRKSDTELQLARALADYDNLYKRFGKEKEEVILRANKSLIQDLLPVLDSLVRAQEHLKDEGLESCIAGFSRNLEENGVSEIPVEVGDMFDATLHEAVDTIAEGGPPAGEASKDGTIAEIVSRGYQWKDGVVLQPAKVLVYKERK